MFHCKECNNPAVLACIRAAGLSIVIGYHGNVGLSLLPRGQGG